MISSFKIYFCHMNLPQLMRRKVAPSWLSVKTLINIPMHSFHRQQKGWKDEVAVELFIYILPHAVVLPPLSVLHICSPCALK